MEYRLFLPFTVVDTGLEPVGGVYVSYDGLSLVLEDRVLRYWFHSRIVSLSGRCRADVVGFRYGFRRSGRVLEVLELDGCSVIDRYYGVAGFLGDVYVVGSVVQDGDSAVIVAEYGGRLVSHVVEVKVGSVDVNMGVISVWDKHRRHGVVVQGDSVVEIAGSKILGRAVPVGVHGKKVFLISGRGMVYSIEDGVVEDTVECREPVVLRSWRGASIVCNGLNSVYGYVDSIVLRAAELVLAGYSVGGFRVVKPLKNSVYYVFLPRIVVLDRSVHVIDVGVESELFITRGASYYTVSSQLVMPLRGYSLLSSPEQGSREAFSTRLLYAEKISVVNSSATVCLPTKYDCTSCVVEVGVNCSRETVLRICIDDKCFYEECHRGYNRFLLPVRWGCGALRLSVYEANEGIKVGELDVSEQASIRVSSVPTMMSLTEGGSVLLGLVSSVTGYGEAYGIQALSLYGDCVLISATPSEDHLQATFAYKPGGECYALIRSRGVYIVVDLSSLITSIARGKLGVVEGYEYEPVEGKLFVRVSGGPVIVKSGDVQVVMPPGAAIKPRSVFMVFDARGLRTYQLKVFERPVLTASFSSDGRLILACSSGCRLLYAGSELAEGERIELDPRSAAGDVYVFFAGGFTRLSLAWLILGHAYSIASRLYARLRRALLAAGVHTSLSRR